MTAHKCARTVPPVRTWIVSSRHADVQALQATKPLHCACAYLDGLQQARNGAGVKLEDDGQSVGEARLARGRARLRERAALIEGCADAGQLKSCTPCRDSRLATMCLQSAAPSRQGCVAALKQSRHCPPLADVGQVDVTVITKRTCAVVVRFHVLRAEQIVHLRVDWRRRWRRRLSCVASQQLAAGRRRWRRRRRRKVRRRPDVAAADALAVGRTHAGGRKRAIQIVADIVKPEENFLVLADVEPLARAVLLRAVFSVLQKKAAISVYTEEGERVEAVRLTFAG